MNIWILGILFGVAAMILLVYYVFLHKRRLWPAIPCALVIVVYFIFIILTFSCGEESTKQSKATLSYSYDLMVTKNLKGNEYYLVRDGENLQYSYIDADYTPYTKNAKMNDSETNFSEEPEQPYVIIRKVKTIYCKRWLFLASHDMEKHHYEYEFHIPSKENVLNQK